MKKNIVHKKVFSLLCAIALLLCSIFTPTALSAISVAAIGEVWDGTTATDFAGGDGTKASPYLISNGAQLHKMAMSGSATQGKYYKLTEDIYLNDVSKDNWKTDNPNKWSSAEQFRGHLDGDGHVIYGVYRVNTSENYSALFFSTYSEATAKNPVSIKNIGIENSYFEGKRAAAFVGKADASASANFTMENCYAGEDVEVKGSIVSGGLIAVIAKTDVAINNCYFIGTVSGDAPSKGGLLGESQINSTQRTTVTVSNSYAATKDDDPAYALPATWGSAPTFTNVYGTKVYRNGIEGITVLTKDQMTGDAAKTNMNGFDFTLTWKTVEGSTPIFYTSTERSAKIWDGTTATAFSGGEGTQAKPYLISNGAQLHKMAMSTSTESKGKYYKLTADIYLNNITDSDWKNNNPNPWSSRQFYGHLDGDGHVIYGVHRVNASYFAGFFDNTYCDDTTATAQNPVSIKNLGIESSYFEGKYAGAFLGKTDGSTYAHFTLENCYAGADVEVKGSNRCGGLISSANKKNVTVNNCYFTGTLSGAGTAGKGGLIGFIGDGKAAAETIKVMNSYAVTTGNDPVVATTSDAQYVKYTNVYGTKAGHANAVGITVITKEQMLGDAAKIFMSGLNFTLAWKTVDGSTPKLYTSAERSNMIWDGKTATSFAGGTGEKDDPWLISNGAQLHKMANSGSATQGKYYKLTADIYLNNIASSDWKTDNPNKWSSAEQFRGHLDGDGHVIYGVYRVNTSENYTALFFSSYSDATAKNPVSIKNLGIENSYFEGKRAAAFLGKADASASANFTIENCYAGEDVEVKGSIVSGGLIAVIAKTDVAINYCYFTGTLSGAASSKGALLGESQISSTLRTTVTISNSYAATKDDSPAYALPATWGSAPTFTNVYATKVYRNGIEGITILTKDQMIGDAAKTNMSGLDFDSDEAVWKTVVGNTPRLRKPNEPSGKIWDGTTATAFDGGDGTQANPYLISNGAQLHKMAISGASVTKGKYYKLTDDIYLNNVVDSDWKNKNPNPWSSAAFYGHLDGNGHVVYGVYSVASTTNGWAALLVNTYCGDTTAKAQNPVSIKNLGIENSYFEGAYAGAFLGKPDGGTYAHFNMENCYAGADVEVKGSKRSGGLIASVAKKNIAINNCYFTGTLSGTATEGKGGLVGYAYYANANDAASTHIVGSFAITTDNDPVFATNDHAKAIGYTHVYGTKAGHADAKGITVLEKEQMIGEAAKTNMNGLNFDAVWSTADNKLPTLRVFSAEGIPEIGGKAGDVWSGKIAATYAGGYGTEAEPYLIENAEQLAKLVYTSVNAPTITNNKYYKLANDIYLNDVSEAEWYKGNNLNEWFVDMSWDRTSLGFMGKFNGNGKTVYGIYRFNGNNSEACGLFPTVGNGAIIENVAVAKSYIANMRHAGSIGGFLCSTLTDKAIIRNCIADKSNVFGSNSQNAGIFACVSRSFRLENCLSLVTLEPGYANLSLVSDINASNQTVEIINCLSIPNVGVQLESVNTKSEIVFENVYSTHGQGDNVIAVGRTQLLGENAVDTLKGFDFDNVWKTVENGTPMLKVFDTNAYSLPKQKVTMSFFTFGGSEIETITGYPGDKVQWPAESSIKRNMDIFDGWYADANCLREYNYDVFPDYNIILYAKWIMKTIEQDFEEYPYAYAGYEGLGLDYERFRPGALNFSTKLVHNGLASLHRMGTEADTGEQDFAVFDDTMGYLETGMEYELSFWVYVESMKSADDLITLVHTDYLDVYEPEFYSEPICKMGDLKIGQWQEVKFTFVAEADYISIRTPELSSIYFDDFMIIPKGMKAGFKPMYSDMSQQNNAGIGDVNDNADEFDNNTDELDNNTDELDNNTDEFDNNTDEFDNNTDESNDQNVDDSSSSETITDNNSVQEPDNSNNNKTDVVTDSEFNWLWIIIPSVALLLICAGIIIILLVKRKNQLNNL